jgi:hypothetical protein
MESKASKTGELQILAIRDFLFRDGHGRPGGGEGGRGGEGGTETQRRRRSKETGGGVVQCATEETTGNGQIRNQKNKIKIVCILLRTVPG